MPTKRILRWAKLPPKRFKRFATRKLPRRKRTNFSCVRQSCQSELLLLMKPLIALPPSICWWMRWSRWNQASLHLARKFPRLEANFCQSRSKSKAYMLTRLEMMSSILGTLFLQTGVSLAILGMTATGRLDGFEVVELDKRDLNYPSSTNRSIQVGFTHFESFWRHQIIFRWKGRNW
mgnify:CR=1 FL=1